MYFKDFSVFKEFILLIMKIHYNKD